MVKAILPKGSKTYIIHPRVPTEYRGVVAASHVTRSLRTQDIREAKRRAPAAMQKLFGEWDALLGRVDGVAQDKVASSGRIIGKAGVYFDNVGMRAPFSTSVGARWSR